MFVQKRSQARLTKKIVLVLESEIMARQVLGKDEDRNGNLSRPYARHALHAEV